MVSEDQPRDYAISNRMGSLPARVAYVQHARVLETIVDDRLFAAAFDVMIGHLENGQATAVTR